MFIKWFHQNWPTKVSPWFTQGSTVIQGIRYDQNTGTLSVRIAGKTYDNQVSVNLANNLSNASSWGKFYNDKIKRKEDAKPTARAAPEVTVDSGVEKTKLLRNLIGLAEIASIALPIPGPAYIRLLTWGTAFAADLLAASEGYEKSLSIEIGSALAGFSGVLGNVKGIGTNIKLILKTPYGSVRYLGAQRTVLGTVTKAQAVRTVLVGGKLLKSTAREARYAYFLTRPPTKLGRAIEAAGMKVTRAKAPITAKFPFKGKVPADVVAQLKKFRKKETALEVSETILQGAAVGLTNYVFRKPRTLKYVLPDRELKKKKKKDIDRRYLKPLRAGQQWRTP